MSGTLENVPQPFRCYVWVPAHLSLRREVCSTVFLYPEVMRISICTARSSTGRLLSLMVLLDRSVEYAGILLLSLCASATKQKESGFPLLDMPWARFSLEPACSCPRNQQHYFYLRNLIYKQVFSQVVRNPAWARLGRFIAVLEEHATELHFS